MQSCYLCHRFQRHEARPQACARRCTGSQRQDNDRLAGRKIRSRSSEERRTDHRTGGGRSRRVHPKRASAPSAGAGSSFGARELTTPDRTPPQDRPPIRAGFESGDQLEATPIIRSGTLVMIGGACTPTGEALGAFLKLASAAEGG